MYGGVGNNQGAVAEEFHFDFIEKNVTVSTKGLEDEYDILMINGQDVFIIEVKTKAHEDDLTRLIEKKAVNFKKLFPMYKDCRQHLGLASFGFYDELIKKALSLGVTVLQRKGDLIEAIG